MAVPSHHYNSFMDQQQLPENIPEDYSDPEQEEQFIDPAVLGNWKIVDLPIIVPSTAQEHQTLAQFKVKLFRFKDDEWKERGVGPLKILRHKATNDTKMVMTTEKTFQCRLHQKMIKEEDCNDLKPILTHTRTWMWKAKDFSDGQPKISQLCAKFTTDDEYQKFKEQFDQICTVKEPEGSEESSSSSEEEEKPLEAAPAPQPEKQ